MSLQRTDPSTTHIFSLIDLSDPTPPPTSRHHSVKLIDHQALGWQTMLVPRPLVSPDPATIELPLSPPSETALSTRQLSQHSTRSNTDPPVSSLTDDSGVKLNPNATAFISRRLDIRNTAPLSFYPGDSLTALPPDTPPPVSQSPRIYSRPVTPPDPRFWHREKLEHQPFLYDIEESWGPIYKADKAPVEPPQHTFDGNVLIANRLGDRQFYSPGPSQDWELRGARPVPRKAGVDPAVSGSPRLDLARGETPERGSTKDPVVPSRSPVTEEARRASDRTVIELSEGLAPKPPGDPPSHEHGGSSDHDGKVSSASSPSERGYSPGEPQEGFKPPMQAFTEGMTQLLKVLERNLRGSQSQRSVMVYANWLILSGKALEGESAEGSSLQLTGNDEKVQQVRAQLEQTVLEKAGLERRLDVVTTSLLQIKSDKDELSESLAELRVAVRFGCIIRDAADEQKERYRVAVLLHGEARMVISPSE